MRTSMQFQCFGKRIGRHSLAALSAGHPAGLLYVTDSLSGERGASEVDVRQAKGGPALEAANGSAIPTFGTRTVALCFSDQRFT